MTAAKRGVHISLIRIAIHIEKWEESLEIYSFTRTTEVTGRSLRVTTPEPTQWTVHLVSLRKDECLQCYQKTTEIIWCWDRSSGLRMNDECENLIMLGDRSGVESMSWYLGYYEGVFSAVCTPQVFGHENYSTCFQDALPLIVEV